ncbi:unnamed protein product [Diatraea saccharalis]|uniref:Uncharacterized protein n=1 Tax=Diatraea saccharalis TaxID=40085 RepID=A0A9N9WFM9_9NEOP|nr:unnamed protein product [Diatraea saccharalis]
MLEFVTAAVHFRFGPFQPSDLVQRLLLFSSCLLPKMILCLAQVRVLVLQAQSLHGTLAGPTHTAEGGLSPPIHLTAATQNISETPVIIGTIRTQTKIPSARFGSRRFRACLFINEKKPAKLLWIALIATGGEAAEYTNTKHGSDRLIIIPDTLKTSLSRHKHVEPVQCKHVLRRPSPYALEDTCIKCGESQIELKKELRMAKMTEDEIDHAARLYASFYKYEKHLDAITLALFSDPTFNISELPASLREMLKIAEIEKPEL